MAIINVQAVQTGLVGVLPSLAYIYTNDTVAEVTSTGYLNKEIANGLQISLPCLASVSTQASPSSPIVANWYQIIHSGLNWNLVAAEGSSNITDQQVQREIFNVGLDSGTADAYHVTLNPVVTSLTDGLPVIFTALNTSITTTPTLQINGLSPITMTRANGTAALAGDISSSTITVCTYSASANSFIIMNPATVSSDSDVTSTQVQESSFNVGNDSGAADAYVVTLSPIVTSLTNALQVAFTALNANVTTTPALTVNSLSPVTITRANGIAVLAGDISTTTITYCIYSEAANAFIILNPAQAGSGGGVTSDQVQQSAFNVGIDSGAADAYVVTLSPAPSDYTDGMLVAFTPLASNLTNNPLINVNGIGQVAITIIGRSVVAVGDINSNSCTFLQYSNATSSFQLLNPLISYAYAYDLITGTNYWTAADIGAVNAYEVNIPYVDTYPGFSADPIFLIINGISATNTGASTITVLNDGESARPIALNNGNALVGGEMVAGNNYFLYHASTGAYILMNPSVISEFITAPAASQDSDLLIGTAYQNTFGVDVMLTLYLDIASATTASIALGVDNNATPTQQTLISSITTVTDVFIPVNIYLPKGYYALLTTTGTISASISGQIAMAI